MPVMATDIASIARSFIGSDQANFVPGTSTPIFDEPRMGIANASDPLFERLRDEGVIGPDHRLPGEWLRGASSVISYFLPISRPVRQSNRCGDDPSEEWIYTRFHGEDLNNRLRRVLVEHLSQAGHGAVAPMLDPGYEVRDMRSNWSERHVAYVAGLGTFGLNAGFITDRGQAGRLGSVVTTLDLEPTPRRSDDHNAGCLWFQTGDCGVCLTRCPVTALSEEGKDRALCRWQLRDGHGPDVRARYGFPYSPCGKCYVGVPCEEKNPVGAA